MVTALLTWEYLSVTYQLDFEDAQEAMSHAAWLCGHGRKEVRVRDLDAEVEASRDRVLSRLKAQAAG